MGFLKTNRHVSHEFSPPLPYTGHNFKPRNKFWFCCTLAMTTTWNIGLDPSTQPKGKTNCHVVSCPMERPIWQRTEGSSKLTASKELRSSVSKSVRTCMLLAGCAKAWKWILCSAGSLPAALRETLRYRHPAKLCLDFRPIGMIR